MLHSDGHVSEQGSSGVADGREQGLGEAVLYFGCRRRDQVHMPLVPLPQENLTCTAVKGSTATTAALHAAQSRSRYLQPLAIPSTCLVSMSTPPMILRSAGSLLSGAPAAAGFLVWRAAGGLGCRRPPDAVHGLLEGAGTHARAAIALCSSYC